MAKIAQLFTRARLRRIAPRTRAPDFKGKAVMADGSIQELALSDFKDKYLCLFFYPEDFTYVCPSEIVAFNKAYPLFEARGVSLIGCSVDSHLTHAAWRKTDLKQGGIGQIDFPLLADPTHKICRAYGVLLPSEGVALRGLFLIDKQGIVRHMVVNDLPLGRSVAETLRMIEALQFTDVNGEVCPADWKEGDKAIKPTAEGIAEYMSALTD